MVDFPRNQIGLQCECITRITQYRTIHPAWWVPMRNSPSKKLMRNGQTLAENKCAIQNVPSHQHGQWLCMTRILKVK